MSKSSKQKQNIPVLTDVIAKGKRIPKPVTTSEKQASAESDIAHSNDINHDELEKIIKRIVEKKLAVYSKLLCSELTRDIIKNLENALQSKLNEDDASSK